MARVLVKASNEISFMAVSGFQSDESTANRHDFKRARKESPGSPDRAARSN
eukprot:CAMPEP_0172463104 /NCGR_PEP_ID=MMETSP1065-20121228/46046_1 /TAXON_ID=265537 /ORGANISM="Amphiprora paludosa, Strain CCMP125" /LENGTH=50 /DNA_ID=CAMNT_0013218967 /DNA_START=128 /DNA_END=277 /DNA_ORIENTATION=-